MNRLREQISSFLIHEETPVDLIINGNSLEDVFAELESILQNSTPETIAHALGFIRDANLFKHPMREAFRKHLETSNVWSTLQKLLTTHNYWVRKNTIYTIAKLCAIDRASLLSGAFPFFLENDPINLPNLISEFCWLTKEWNWDLIEQIAAAKHFLQRWSLCQLLDDDGSSVPIKQRFLDILKPLKTDPEPLIAAEAAFRFERINIKTGPKPPKSEWNQQVKKNLNLKPRITFESSAMQFMPERTDYTVNEFERFVKALG